MKLFAGRLKEAEARRSRENIRLDRSRIHWQILVLLGLSLTLTIIIEIINRRSAAKFAVFVVKHPVMFLLDAYLIFNTLAISMLFRRRRAVQFTLALLWLVLAVVNFIVISFRTQPFTLPDILLVKDMFSLITVYFTWYEIGLMAVALVGVVALIVTVFIRAPRSERVPYMPVAVSLALVTALSFGFIRLGQDSGYILRRFTTLKDAYQDYGFAYTFLETFADMGIARPSNYSPDIVDDIIETIEEPSGNSPVGVIKPNIIFVQLESFFDTDTISDNVVFSRNPTPYFHELLEKWPSGKLYVPVVGGGTANTEFEMLTGMNLDFFGAGEYPYYTVLRDTPCETICYVLNRKGYTSTAVHNYMATFYGRNEVYSRLGFNRFESMEYMDDLEYGDVGWPKDDQVLASTISAMESTPGRDFIMAITVGTHGKYSADTLTPGAQMGIKVLETDEYLDKIQLQNYINLAREMDDFLREFIEAMSEFPEPVICVFYGDHLPALEWDSSCIKSGNLFETQYCIWTNYGRRFEAPDIQAYRLSANLLQQLGIDDGVIFRYHQQTALNDEGVGYLTELEILEYDMLYGELEVFQGEYPFEPTVLQLGIDDVIIESVELRYGRLLVRGDNFNEFSTIVVDGEHLPTAYIDKNTIAAVVDALPEDDAFVAVAQVSDENVELTRTASWPVTDIDFSGAKK